MGSDARQLGINCSAWQKVMAAYHWVCGFGHLQADCQEDQDQLGNPMLVSSMGLPLPLRQTDGEQQI